MTQCLQVTQTQTIFKCHKLTHNFWEISNKPKILQNFVDILSTIPTKSLNIISCHFLSGYCKKLSFFLTTTKLMCPTQDTQNIIRKLRLSAFLQYATYLWCVGSCWASIVSKVGNSLPCSNFCSSTYVLHRFLQKIRAQQWHIFEAENISTRISSFSHHLQQFVERVCTKKRKIFASSIFLYCFLMTPNSMFLLVIFVFRTNTV